MTLSELLRSLDFDRIMPFIGKYHGDDRCMAGYKLHYDILCNTLPQAAEESSHTIAISYYEPLETERNLPEGLLDAHSLEGELWEVSLGKELAIAPEVTASDAEIAACCLFHTSFYGFTPKDLRETFKEISCEDETCNALEAKRILSVYGKLVPGKRRISRGRDFHHELRAQMRPLRCRPLSKKEKEDRDFPLERKRCWRRWKRRLTTQLYNETVSQRGRFIEHMLQGECITAPVDADLLTGLFSAGRCRITSYRTCVNDASRRFENFRDLILKYGAFKYARLQNCILSISSSSDYPILMEELQLIEHAAKGCDQVFFSVMVDDSLGRELEIKAAFYQP